MRQCVQHAALRPDGSGQGHAACCTASHLLVVVQPPVGPRLLGRGREPLSAASWLVEVKPTWRFIGSLW